MPFSYTEGYKKFKNQIFKVTPATVAPYKPKISMKTGDSWKELQNTDSLYLDVLYHGTPCDENGNEIKSAGNILKVVISILKFILGLAVFLAIVYFLWKKLGL